MQEEQQVSKQEQQSLHQSLRFVEEICCLLKLSRPCTKTAMDYYFHFSNSQTHKFQIEIMIAASIFLTTKIFQSDRKIRDILNMIFVVTSLHKIIRQEQDKDENQRVTLKNLIEQGGIKGDIQPSYSINSYNQYKSQILEAEQHLLRIIGFDFSGSQKNLTEIKSILVLIHQLRLSQIAAQAILNTYNDLPFTGVEKWISGVIYFGYLVGNIAEKHADHPYQQNIIKDEEWQTIFCTKIQKLRSYANKIADYYGKKQEIKQDNKNLIPEQKIQNKQMNFDYIIKLLKNQHIILFNRNMTLFQHIIAKTLFRNLTLITNHLRVTLMNKGKGIYMKDKSKILLHQS